MNRSSSDRAFTLIELLIVIGLLAVLLGILGAAVSAARGRASEVRCASQLRALGVVFAIYTLEDPAHSTIAVDGPASGGSDWLRVLEARGTRVDVICPQYIAEETSVCRSSYMVTYMYNGKLEKHVLARQSLSPAEVALAGENRTGSGEIMCLATDEAVRHLFGWKRHRLSRGGNILWLDRHVTSSADEKPATVFTAWTLSRVPT